MYLVLFVVCGLSVLAFLFGLGEDHGILSGVL
jgi:hypothetical protein